MDKGGGQNEKWTRRNLEGGGQMNIIFQVLFFSTHKNATMERHIDLFLFLGSRFIVIFFCFGPRRSECVTRTKLAYV